LFDLREHILAQVKGAGSLPIIDEAYDVVVCSNGFAPGQIYPDAIEEMLRLELEGEGGSCHFRHCVGVMLCLDIMLVVQVLFMCTGRAEANAWPSNVDTGRADVSAFIR
jgi:ubiquinone/menaquinone biosynthesis C-methylase UbiE